MKTTSAELKLRARRSLLGNYGTAIGAFLLNYAVTFGCVIVMYVAIFLCARFSAAGDPVTFAVVLGIVVLVFYIVLFFVELMMVSGILRIYLNLGKSGRAKITDIFFAFTNHPGKFLGIVLLLILLGVITVLPVTVLSIATAMSGNYDFYMVFLAVYYVLLTAVSLYIWLNYGLFFQILVEDPKKGLIESLKESRDLMGGNRWRCVCLNFSFLGWILFGYLTCGVAFLWLMPYMLCTQAHFYLDLKPQVEEIPPQWKTAPVEAPNPADWEQAEVWQEPEGFQEQDR